MNGITKNSLVSMMKELHAIGVVSIQLSNLMLKDGQKNMKMNYLSVETN